jgi:DNA-binding NtrC family response regulator
VLQISYCILGQYDIFIIVGMILAFAEESSGVIDVLKILLVDDKELILYSLSRSLRQSGAEVTEVSNGKDALRAIQSTSYDICFLDVQLTDANGMDLMKTFQELSPKTRFIIMTALNLNNEQQQYLADNNCRYLPKPFDLDQVQSLVREISPSQNISQA